MPEAIHFNLRSLPGRFRGISNPRFLPRSTSPPHAIVRRTRRQLPRERGKGLHPSASYSRPIFKRDTFGDTRILCRKKSASSNLGHVPRSKLKSVVPAPDQLKVFWD